MSHIRPALVLAAALWVSVGTTYAADAAAAHAPAKPDVATVSKSSDLTKLIDQFTKRRDSMLADRQALLDQLKNATAEQRKQILEKMQAQQKDLIEAQRALGKQIRDEMRKLRESTPGSRR